MADWKNIGKKLFTVPNIATKLDKHAVLDTILSQPLKATYKDAGVYGLPPYGRGGAELLAYLEDKQATGLIESVTADLPPNVKVQIRLCAGAYRDVIEPWLEEFVHSNMVSCKVVAWRLGGRQLGKDFTREELRDAAPDMGVLAAMEVTPYFKGGGRFEYGGLGYR